MAEPALRVLHVIESLARGGAEQLLVTTLPALKAQGVTPMVAVLHGPYDLQGVLEAEGVKVLHVPRFNRWNLLAGRHALGAICKQANVDVLHAHLYFPGIYAGLLGAAPDRPLFETFHNMAYAGANRGGLKLALRKQLRAIVARYSGARFLAVSQAVADHYSDALGLTHVAPLPNSVDLAAIARIGEQARAKIAQASEGITPLKIIVPGRLVPEKGHVDLLDALRDADLPPYTLHFLGGGSLESELREKAGALSIPVTISGLIPHEEFLEAMADADLCVAPSRFEGFGIAAAEAMALGIATIASGAGGLPEVIGDAGVLVKAGDVAALRNAIVQLANDPERRAALAEAGKTRIAERFSSEAAAAELASIYRGAVAG